jgi:ferredoxin
VPCLRYVSEANILGAFRLGAAGVALLGCEKCQHGKREMLYHKLDFTALTLDAFGLGNERVGFFTTEAGKEQETVGDLTRFAEGQSDSPIHSDGRPLSHWGNREVVADAIGRFIEQTALEPGLKPLDAAHPFAVAEVAAGGCTMCRSCVNVCPTHAFRVDEGNLSLQFKQIACVACGLCEKLCPEHVITLKREVSFDRAALDYQTVVKDSMIACARCRKPYINRKALEMVEARVLAFPILLDTFSGNRRDLLRMCPDCRSVAAMLEVEKGWKP